MKTSGIRKMIIFGVCIIIGIIVSLFMPIDFFGKFLDFLGMIAIGFFAGNGLEHIGDNLSKGGK